jgi:hypothetical protein
MAQVNRISPTACAGNPTVVTVEGEVALDARGRQGDPLDARVRIGSVDADLERDACRATIRPGW